MYDLRSNPNLKPMTSRSGSRAALSDCTTIAIRSPDGVLTNINVEFAQDDRGGPSHHRVCDVQVLIDTANLLSTTLRLSSRCRVSRTLFTMAPTRIPLLFVSTLGLVKIVFSS